VGIFGKFCLNFSLARGVLFLTARIFCELKQYENIVLPFGAKFSAYKIKIMTPFNFNKTIIIDDLYQYFSEPLNSLVLDQSDIFFYFTIFQSFICNFIDDLKKYNFENVIITNIKTQDISLITNNLLYLKLNFFKIKFDNDTIFKSFRISIINCWSVPSQQYDYIDLNSFNHFFYSRNIMNNNNLYILTLPIYLDWLNFFWFYNNFHFNNNIHINYSEHNNNSCIFNLQHKQAFSNIIFDNKDNMPDSTFMNIMEAIKLL
tara:strand:+ start:406 stop:1185 length:780 start_codon:yes stop_codon:yes gene_type:complete